MVSRRNFLSITVMMLVVLFLFQSTRVYYERVANYEENEYRAASVMTADAAWQFPDVDVNAPVTEDSYVLFAGDRNGGIAQTVRQWCGYTKRDLVFCDSPASFAGIVDGRQEYVLVDAAGLDWETEGAALRRFAEAGSAVVFCSLPTAEVIDRYSDLRDLLGVRRVLAEDVDVMGIRLFSGFLLGGEVIYTEREGEEELQDLQLTMPWYELASGTQTYMVGLMEEAEKEDSEITREMLPAVLWSHQDKGLRVFAVNGDYMQDATGIGILSAMDAKLNRLALYPVVDAQVLSVVNYAALADENAQVMYREFSSRMTQAARDIIQPQIVATAKQTGFRISCMLLPQYDYTDDAEPMVRALDYQLKLLKETEAEVGISLTCAPETDRAAKAAADAAFWEDADTDYLFGAAYLGGMAPDDAAAEEMPEGVRTLIPGMDTVTDVIGFADNGMTVQALTGDAAHHSYRDDLRMRSIQTALGYSNVLMDIGRALWPEEDELSWTELSKQFASNLYTYWQPYQQLTDETVSGSDRKIRNMLTLDYRYEIEGDTLVLDLENVQEEVSFILHLHDGETVGSISGASCTELEKNTYMIRTSAARVEIGLSAKPLIAE